MPVTVLEVGVYARLRPPATRWGVATLIPCAVVWPVPAEAPPAEAPPAGASDAGAPSGAVGEGGLRALGVHPLALHTGDTGHHRDNLSAARPAIWVALAEAQDPARAAVRLVTADPYEGGGLADDGALVVEAVPMPPALAAEIAAFVAAHHVEIPFEKRRRAPATSPADPRAPHVLRPEDKWGRR